MTTIVKQWTTSTNFDEGTYSNTTSSAVANQVQLVAGSTAGTFRYVCAPMADPSGLVGRVTRIDADTGAVVGQYFTAPSGYSRTPYAMCCDASGCVWVGNREEQSVNSVSPMGSVVKIGLVVGGVRCDADGTANPVGIYRKAPFRYNNTGATLVRSSFGAGSTGDTTGDGPLTWTDAGDGLGGGSSVTSAPVADALDDCLLVYQRTDCKLVHCVAVDASDNVWVGGWNNSSTIEPFDKLSGTDGNRLTVVPGGAASSSVTGGRGGFISSTPSHEYVWSCDPANPAASGSISQLSVSGGTEFRLTFNPTGDFWYGMAEDASTGNFYISTGVGTAQRLRKYNHEGTSQTAFGTSGQVILPAGVYRTLAFAAGDVWCVSSTGNVYRINGTTGATVATIAVPSPDGICTAAHSDGVPRVWVCVNVSTPGLYRINTGTNAVDLIVGPVGSGLGCSALGPLMASSVPTAAVYLSGSWQAVYDAGNTTSWSTIAWHDTVAAAQTLTIQYGVSEALETLAVTATAATVTAEGLTAHSTAMSGSGRYAIVRVLFDRDSLDSATSTLRDLTITGTAIQSSTHDPGRIDSIDPIPLDPVFGQADGMATGTGGVVGCVEMVGAIAGEATPGM